ncbi:recombinase family protein [Phytoactinopolyspora limicola]|uniref:recombinase family protein n=1 Tax=Phytoactinopolyspora limicola TaxID=2715536 RepID=UPI00140A9479|nr:recombinase family protein [Phytoactinopolyspora limicola]
MPPRAAAIYCRLSYAPDGSLEKVERQEADCRELAARLGWPVADIYPDNSRSAWQRNRKRPQWERMLADIEAGRIDGIIVYHGDRLIRQPWDLELLLKLADDRRLPLTSVTGTRDLNSEDDRFILRIEAAQACRSSADTSRRVKRGWAARAQRGEPIGGGKRPFGWGVPSGKTGKTGKPIYDTTQQVPGEASVLREAADRLMAGQSQGGIVAWMNEVSRTSQGALWTPKSLKNLMQSPRIAGLIEHGGQLHEAAWEPLLSVEEWEDVKAILRRSAAEHGYAGRERRYLLSGVAECSRCGGKLRTKPSGGRNRVTSRLYHCTNRDCPGRVSRNVDRLDAYVSGRVLRRLNEPGFVEALHADDEQPGVGAEIATLERRKNEALATLRSLADHPDVSAEVVAASLESFDRRIRELRARLVSTTRQRLLARMSGITRDQWDAEPIDVRAETVRALFRVIVLPATWRGPGFDPASVRMIRLSNGA